MFYTALKCKNYAHTGYVTCIEEMHGSVNMCTAHFAHGTKTQLYRITQTYANHTRFKSLLALIPIIAGSCEYNEIT
jgi:hypothetical protein